MIILKIKMKNRLNQYLVLLTAFAIIFANTAMGFAVTSDFEDVADVQVGAVVESVGSMAESGALVESAVLVDDFEAVPESGAQVEATVVDDSVPTKESEQFLSRLRQELQLSKSDYHQLLNSIEDTRQRLDQVKDEKISLAKQISNLEGLVADSSEKLLKALGQIVEIENEVSLLYEQIEMREVAIEYQKQLLRDYTKLLYQEENAYLSIDSDGEINTYKLLLSDGSVGDNLKQLKYFDLLNETGQQILERLDGLYQNLNSEKIKLETRKKDLSDLSDDLLIQKQQLVIQKEAKENLLRLTGGQEEIYAQLLEQSIAEQEGVVGDIKSLSDALYFLEDRMNELGEDFDPADYKDFLSDKNKSLYDFQLRHRFDDSGQFSWPVDPTRGLSAYFRDPSYAGVFGVRHNAVDIPTYQGTPVRAASDGVVFTAKDNGYGYSYIILLHSGGVSTVYGHISNILVSEGDVVSRGTIIGLSGGMPGTKGAGYMTTGPHLHFEAHLDDEYVDPLNYLPLEVLTEEQMEFLPEKYQVMWDEAVFGVELLAR